MSRLKARPTKLKNVDVSTFEQLLGARHFSTTTASDRGDLRGLRDEIEEGFLHFASRQLRRSEVGEKASARFGRNDSSGCVGLVVCQDQLVKMRDNKCCFTWNRLLRGE